MEKLYARNRNNIFKKNIPDMRLKYENMKYPNMRF